MAVHASIDNKKFLASIFTFLLVSLVMSFLQTAPAASAASANSRSILSSFSSDAVEEAGQQQSRPHNLRVARAIADAKKLTEDERNQFINELVMAELARRNAFLSGLLTMQPLGQNAPSSQIYSNGFGAGAANAQAAAVDFQRTTRDDERSNVGASNKWDVLSRAMPRFGKK